MLASGHRAGHALSGARVVRTSGAFLDAHVVRTSGALLDAHVVHSWMHM